MTLRLTPDILAGAYEFLRTTPPFRGWRLPHADAISFIVSRTWPTQGHYTREIRKPDSHEIHISERCIGSTHRLLEVLSHEMLHLHQEIRMSFTANTDHNAEFRKLAKLICKHHTFDPVAFV